MTFQPTTGQRQALEAVVALETKFPDGGGVLVIGGPAGTGKTSLLQALADRNPTVVTPTGKSACRVTEATGLPAQTIHRWCYTPYVDEETETILYRLKDEVEGSGLVVIDEASMVSRVLWEDVRDVCAEAGLNIVLLGDNFQLKPVAPGEPAWSVFDPEFPADARVGLTEILRQAWDSPIIRVAQAVRTGTDTEVMSALMDLPVVPTSELVPRALELEVTHRGATLCWTNRTRKVINRCVRAEYLKDKDNRDPDQPPLPEEPLLVLRNNYVVDCYNGEIIHPGAVVKILGNQVPVRSKRDNLAANMDFWEVTLGDRTVVVSPQEIVGTLPEGFPELAIDRAAARLTRTHYWDLDALQRPSHIHANLGYVLTTHKYQGSEQDDIIVCIEPRQGLYTQDQRRHLYTSLTRARKRVTMCYVNLEEL